MLKIIRFLFVPLLLLWGICYTNASEKFRFGLFTSFNYYRTEGDLRQFESIGDSVPKIVAGSDFGFSLGILGKYSFSGKIFVTASLGFAFQNSDNTLAVNLLDSIGDAICLREEYRLRFRNSRFVFNPELQYEFLPNLSFFGGFELGYNLPSNYSLVQRQECRDTISQNLIEYVIPYPNEGKPKYPITTQLDFGFEYRIPTAIFDLFELSLNAKYTFGFTNVSANYTSDINSFQLQFKFFPIYRKLSIVPLAKDTLPPSKQEIAIIQPPIPSLPVMSQNIELPAKRIKIDVVGVEDSGYAPAVVYYRREIAKHFVPLLNYIFFDYGSSEIPERYFQFDSNSQIDFSESKLFNLSLLDVYHHILNIVGSRLRLYPEAKITITGCNSNIGEEERNLELSKARAKAVSRYLTEVWGINPERIAVQERNLPSKPSNDATPDGVQENQRVEIYSETPEILAPVVNLDTVVFFSPKILRFYISKDTLHSILRTKLSFEQSQFSNFAIFEEKPDSIDLLVNNLLSKQLSVVNPIDYQWTSAIFDGKDTLEENVSGSIPVVVLPSERKNNLQKLSLLLFDFNSSNLDALQIQSLRKFRSIIQNSKVIEVAGYTDAIGNEDYNLKLSTERAQRVAKHLGIQNVSVVGYGESAPFVESRTPEGRFYLRTVQIIFEK